MRSVRGKGTEAGKVCTPPRQVVTGTGMPVKMAETGTAGSAMTENETGIAAGNTTEIATTLTRHQGEGMASHLACTAQSSRALNHKWGCQPLPCTLPHVTTTHVL